MAAGAFQPHAVIAHSIQSIFRDKNAPETIPEELNPYIDRDEVENIKDEIFKQKFQTWCLAVSTFK